LDSKKRKNEVDKKPQMGILLIPYLEAMFHSSVEWGVLHQEKNWKLSTDGHNGALIIARRGATREAWLP
jgi:hypothetical protein